VQKTYGEKEGRPDPQRGVSGDPSSLGSLKGRWPSVARPRH